MSAVISECGQYRYWLQREVASNGIVIAFFGVNPSTADASTDDATIRKWRGFAQRNNCRRFVVGNVFAFRSTDVSKLAEVKDPEGPDNAHMVNAMIADADLLVPCWGSRGKLPPKLRPYLDALEKQLRASGKPIKVFGLTKSGDPAHPLMLGYATSLVDWRKA